MSSEGSVSGWIGRLRAGDQAAAQQVWERYFHQLVSLARSKLEGAPRRLADEEDVALSALDSVCRGLTRGRFPRLADRSDLWSLLVVITARKAVDLRRHEGRQKRGGAAAPLTPGAEVGSSSTSDLVLEQILDREPTPEFAAQVAESYQHLLSKLEDVVLRAVAVYKIEGYTHEEIAGKLGCVPRTVERKLRVIRKLWIHEESS